MIQKLRYILLMITALLGGNAEAWAQTQTTSYVCNDANQREWSTIDNSGDYVINGPANTLSFEAKRTDIKVVINYGNTTEFYAEYSTDGGAKWTKVLKLELEKKDTWYYFSCEIPINANRVRMATYTGATGKKQIRNVKVTRATTLSMSSTNTLPLNIGEVKIGKTVSATVYVDYNNTTHPQTLTGSCDDNPAFTVEPCLEMGEYGTATPVTINFKPTTAGEHKGTVTLSMKGVKTYFEVIGTAQDKGTPAFTWNLSQAYINRNYKNFFSSTNTDLPYTITSNNPDIAQVVGDSLIVVGGTEGTVNFTVSQQGNDDWHAKTETFSVKVSKPQNHLPLSITESNQAELVDNKAGSYTWEDGIKLGDGGDGFDWDDKIAQIDFQGIPDRISFNYERGNSTASGVAWRVEVSSNGSNWSEIWSSTDASGSADIEISDKSSKSVRLIWSGNFGGYFRNVQITELRYLTSSTSTIDFGENVEGDAVTKTFTLGHANAGYGVTLVSSNPDAFEVSPSILTTTGGDKMGEETITVTYKNNTVGKHSGTITIADPNGTNAPVSVDLSATTISSGLILNPTQTPDYDVRTYKRVVLQRTLPMGYSTITLPFTYNIGAVDGAYVAQLELVTHNQQDGYTLYFQKVSDGIMHPHQPYVLYLPIEIANPEWSETAVSSPDAQNIQKSGWTMQANYTPGVSMEGKYGIVEGKLCLGGAGSTINAYTAYFIPPAEAKGRVRVAMLDNDGTTTYIHSLSDTESDKETTAIYRMDGTRQTALTKGINIVRMQDGSVRKVLK